jgi:hypothetical protein
MGLDDEKKLSVVRAKDGEKIPNEDQLPKNDDNEEVWIKYSMNVHLINDPLRLEGILNLCKKELEKKDLYFKRVDWVQRVLAAVMTRIAEIKGDFSDTLGEEENRKSAYNV